MKMMVVMRIEPSTIKYISYSRETLFVLFCSVLSYVRTFKKCQI